MSNTHSSPTTFTPRHPLLAGDLYNDDLTIRDALDNGTATLLLLSELFADEESDLRLDAPRVRRGVFLQIQGVAELLIAIEKTMGSRVSEPAD